MYFKEFQKYTIVHIKESEDIYKITSDSFVYVDTSLLIKSKYTISNKKNIVLIGNNHSLILERNTTLKFENCTNIKLENLCFESLGTPNANGEISLQFCNCQNVEITRCTFIDCEDEQLAIKHKSNNFYLEHCKFILTKNEYHSFAVLIGYQKNDSLENCVSINTISGTEQVGGIVGYCLNANVNFCVNDSTVNGSYKVGGVIGEASCTINQCVNKAVVTCATVSGGEAKAGGIAGEANLSTISKCANRVKISSGNQRQGNQVGGIAGSAHGNISDCYDSAIVFATHTAGGLVGYS